MNQDATPQAQRLARLQSYLQRDPENWNLRADVFDAALEAGALGEAREVGERALAERPGEPSWRHRMAMLLLASDRYPEAQVELESLVADGHGAAGVIHNLAYSVFMQGRPEQAAAVLEPLLTDPTEEAAIAWPLWLRCMHHLRRTEAGLDALARRLQAGPVPADALGVAALMATDADRLPDAARWADQALAANPDQFEALAARGTLGLATQNGPETLRWFERALRRSPTDGRCWSGMALGRLLVADLHGADEAFSRAVVTMPSHIGTWIAWGWCQLLLGRKEDALRAFDRSLEIDRNFGEGHGGRAVALARLGRSEESARELKVALRLDPTGVSGRYARAILEGKDEDPQVIQTLVEQGRRWKAPRPD